MATCPTHAACDNGNPFANLSAEAPEQPIYLGRFFPRRLPPLMQWYTGQGCNTTCTSTVSQLEADLCAARNAIQCITDPPIDPPNPPDPPCEVAGDCSFTPPEPPATPTTSTPPLPCNTAQECCVECPDGTQFCYTVPECSFNGRSVTEANAIAYSFACRQAALQKICLSGSPARACLDTPYTFLITVSSRQTSFSWNLTDGSLPPGLTMDISEDTRRALISGNPTTPGTYDFELRVSDTLGNFMAHEYTIIVMGITNESLPEATPNVAYSTTLTAAGGTAPRTFALYSGSLPDGLSLSSAGVISGTPATEAESKEFQVAVTDATGAVCICDLEIRTPMGFMNTLQTVSMCGSEAHDSTNFSSDPDENGIYAQDGNVYAAAGHFNSMVSQTSADNAALAAAQDKQTEWLLDGSFFCCPNLEEGSTEYPGSPEHPLQFDWVDIGWTDGFGTEYPGANPFTHPPGQLGTGGGNAYYTITNYFNPGPEYTLTVRVTVTHASGSQNITTSILIGDNPEQQFVGTGIKEATGPVPTCQGTQVRVEVVCGAALPASELGFTIELLPHEPPQ